MKFPAMLLLLLVGHASASADKLNPITRVVQLLEGLAKKIEQDGKMEEELYETYVCWAKTVISTKTATNEAAKSRIEELEGYIDDIESGRVEFTGERADLEAQIKSLHSEIETAEDMREKEKADFEAAEDEMKKAIAALEQAVEVLSEATAEKKEGLLGMNQAITREVETFKEGEHKSLTLASEALKNAIQLGQRYLSKSDALFLQRVLSGEVPKADWKKLNRKATFKMKYKARSGKIQTILGDMLATFKSNLEDATKKEKLAEKTHKELMKSKGDELEGSQQALADGEKEGSARGMAKEEAAKEVEDLKKQVEADEGYIKDTKDALEKKKEEWKVRVKLRTQEIAAINKAIAILNSDEARDTMRSSFKSQGYLLLQKSRKSTVQQRAFALLRQVGGSVKDPRLAQLTMLLQAAEGPLDEVISMIDEMVQTLKDEEADDLEKKETCEKEREEQTASARKLSLKIDDFTDVMTRNRAKIEELKALIEEKEAAIKKMQEDLEEAKRNREKEKAEYEAAKADDEAAAKLIENAKNVLKDFYDNIETTLLQRAAQPPTNIEAGKAPPPPPATFDEPYGGAKGEATGIQAILGMILEDVKADIKKADEAEKQAIEEYESFKKDTEESIEANKKAIEDMEGQIADCEKKIAETIEERNTAKKELDSVLEEIKVREPGCDFMTINFDVRAKNRQMEIDGLLKAKAILQGGKFE